jgi:hypothetical protein
MLARSLSLNLRCEFLLGEESWLNLLPWNPSIQNSRLVYLNLYLKNSMILLVRYKKLLSKSVL